MNHHFYVCRNRFNDPEVIKEILWESDGRVGVRIHRKSESPSCETVQWRHFFDDPEDPLSATEGVENLGKGLDLLLEHTVWVHSGIGNWPTLINDALDNGCRRFRTSQEAVQALIKSNAGRLGFEVEVILCDRPTYPWEDKNQQTQ